MSDDIITDCETCGAVEQIIEHTDTIEALRAENARLRGQKEGLEGLRQGMSVIVKQLQEENARHKEMLGNVSRGVQAIRVEQNVAAVWLPAIQEIRAYFRELDARTAIREGDAG